MRLRAAPLAIVVGLGACTAGPAHDDAELPGEATGTTRAALSPSDPVSLAVSDVCSTTSVKALSTQLVEEMQCMKPGTFAAISGVAGLELGEAVFPFLQTPAARAVAAAQADRGSTMTINSALRTLPQQFLLYRWYQTGRCGISLAAQPGRSNHESGLAVDVEDNAGWRSFMGAHEMKWLGASDPVHFDYVGAGAVDVDGLSVRAFQRLWNRNHPEDPIAEDGDYGTETAERLATAPVGGFAKGAECNEPPAPQPAADAGAVDAAAPTSARPEGEADGCSCRAAGAARGASGGGAAPVRALALAVAAAVAAAARRRRAPA